MQDWGEGLIPALALVHRPVSRPSPRNEQHGHSCQYPFLMTGSAAPWTARGIVAWETRFDQESLERRGLQQDGRTVQL